MWIFGVIKIAEFLCLWIRRPVHRPQICNLLPLCGHLSDPETLLFYFESVASWSPESQAGVVLDCGLDKESYEACKKWCANSRLIFCTQKEWEEICKGSTDKVY